MTAEASAAEAPETPRSPDGYTAVEAARIVGVSERRIRQLADAGRLPVVNSPDAPLRVGMEAVHRMREERRKEEQKGLRTEPAEPPPPFDAEALVTRLIDRMLPRMLEGPRIAEESARAMALEERSLRLQREAELIEERVARRLAEERLAELERRNTTEPPAGCPPEEAAGGSGRRRTWWGRRLD